MEHEVGGTDTETVLDRLMGCPPPELGNWPDYDATGLGPEDEAELISLATSELLVRAKPDTPLNLARVHAWRILSQWESTAAVEPLLALLERAMDDEWVSAELPVVLGKMGPDAFDLLRGFAVDTTRPIRLRTFAAEALADISQRHPQVREAGAATLLALLSGFEHQDVDFNTIVTSCLLGLEVREAAPLIEAAFASARVDPGFVGDWEDVQDDLGLIPDETFLSLLECEDTAIQFVLREINVDAVGNANRRLGVLERFLSASGRPHAISTLTELRGFLFAVLCTPGEVEIAAWVKRVLAQHNDFTDLREAVEVMWALGDLFYGINRGILDREMPEGITFHADPLANLADEASVAQWSRGFLAAHDWLRPTWEPLPPLLKAALGEVLSILTFFASARMAEHACPALAEGWGIGPEEVAAYVVREWPDAHLTYAALGRLLFHRQLGMN